MLSWISYWISFDMKLIDKNMILLRLPHLRNQHLSQTLLYLLPPPLSKNLTDNTVIPTLKPDMWINRIPKPYPHQDSLFWA